MTGTARLLIALIGVAAVAAVVGWVVRYQPFGPPAARGLPLPTEASVAREWESVGEAPLARLEMATAVHEGRFWLAGGYTPEGAATDALSIFDPEGQRWHEEPALPQALHHAALASDGRRLYLVGGYQESGEPTAAVRIFDARSGEWSSGPTLPEPRAAGALAYDGSRMVYGGGVGPGGVRDEVFVLDGDAWVKLGAMTRSREHLAATTDAAGRVWLMGGRQGGLDRNVGDVEVVEGDTITLVGSLTARGGVAAFFEPALGACLTGGEAPSFAFAIVECIDTSGGVTALPEMSQRRHGHGAGVIEGKAYVLLGGAVQGLSTSSTIEVLLLE